MTERPKGRGSRRAASKSSGVVVAARKLSQRSQRESQHRCLADGPQSVEYGLRADVIDELFVSESGDARHAALVEQALDCGVDVFDVDETVLKQLSDTRTPQGIVGVARIPLWDADCWQQRPRLVVALEHAQDPGNLGVVARTADAAGADFVVLGPGSADPFGPKCVRASAGSVFRIPVLTTTDVGGLFETAHAADLVCRGTAGDGSIELLSDDLDLARPTMWILGNEANGLSEQAQQASDELVRIPMYGAAESLNVGIAAGILLYASAMAQRAGVKT